MERTTYFCDGCEKILSLTQDGCRNVINSIEIRGLIYHHKGINYVDDMEETLHYCNIRCLKKYLDNILEKFHVAGHAIKKKGRNK